MDEIRYEDLVQLFKNTVVLHKNKPVYVEDIAPDKTFFIKDLATQRSKFVPFSMKDFTGPKRRIGCVNIGNSVVYVARIPVRRYKMGLSADNTQVKFLEDVDYNSKAEIKQRIARFDTPEIADAMNGVYPSFEEAIKRAIQFHGTVAFDKQFSVCCRRYIHYKHEMVGKIKTGKSQISDIVFNDGKEYLSSLLKA